jgi:histidine triad (HIT) family protein
MNSSKTIFQKILAKEIPAHILYEDEEFFVLLDILPVNVGHCLLITKKPYTDIFSMEDDILRKIMPYAKRLSLLLKEALNADGVKFVQNNGAAAGQEVMHYHLHLIPGYNSEPKSLPKKTELKELSKLLEPYFKRWN